MNALAERWDDRLARIAAIAEGRDEARPSTSLGDRSPDIALAPDSGSGHHRGVESTRLDRWLWAVRLMSNNPEKVRQLEGAGIEVLERVPCEPRIEKTSRAYLKTKKAKMGHLLKGI